MKLSGTVTEKRAICCILVIMELQVLYRLVDVPVSHWYLCVTSCYCRTLNWMFSLGVVRHEFFLLVDFCHCLFSSCQNA